MTISSAHDGSIAMFPATPYSWEGWDRTSLSSLSQGIGTQQLRSQFKPLPALPPDTPGTHSKQCRRMGGSLSPNIWVTIKQRYGSLPPIPTGADCFETCSNDIRECPLGSHDGIFSQGIISRTLKQIDGVASMGYSGEIHRFQQARLRMELKHKLLIRAHEEIVEECVRLSAEVDAFAKDNSNPLTRQTAGRKSPDCTYRGDHGGSLRNCEWRL